MKTYIISIHGNPEPNKKPEVYFKAETRSVLEEKVEQVVINDEKDGGKVVKYGRKVEQICGKIEKIRLKVEKVGGVTANTIPEFTINSAPLWARGQDAFLIILGPRVLAHPVIYWFIC